jgi:hypothetical protein
VTIDKLKLEHGAITVDYSGLLESFRIVTMDEAQAGLYQAAANVAILGRLALGMVVEGAGFVSIDFSHGDEPGSKLSLSMPTYVGDPAKISCPKISAAPVRENGEVIEDHPRNLYNSAVEILEAEIVSFVKGKRLQMALPFDQSPEERKLTKEFGEVMAGVEVGTAGGKMFRFAEAVAP